MHDVSKYILNFIIPVKKGIMFFTQPLGLPVCLCVCHQDCDEMAGLSNTVIYDVITPDNSSKMQHYQDDPLAGSGLYGSFIQNYILAYNFKSL